jgi:hypothetical protein
MSSRVTAIKISVRMASPKVQNGKNTIIVAICYKRRYVSDLLSKRMEDEKEKGFCKMLLYYRYRKQEMTLPYSWQCTNPHTGLISVPLYALVFRVLERCKCLHEIIS